MKKLADRMVRIPPSGTIMMAEIARKMEREGRKVYHLEVGEPDFDTPEHIKQAAYKAIKEGFTHYTSSRGIPELREAVAEYLKNRRNIDADPEKEILITPGTKHAIYCCCQATIDEGDEVLMLSPIWTTFFAAVKAAGGKPIEVPTDENYDVDEENLKGLISEKTKMIVINSPNNPTGGVAGEDTLKLLRDLAVERDLLVLSDEIYERFLYDGVESPSIASFDGMKERTIVVNGWSKAYAMTGWRLGYAVAEKSIIDAMLKIQQMTTTCPSSFVQKAGLEAYRGPQECVEEMVKEYDKRRKAIVDRLNSINGVKCPTPKGAFYVFPDFTSFKAPSSKIVEKLLVSKGVCATPGTAFGEKGEGHIRFSYATSLNVINEAMGLLAEFVEEELT
ncbi:pyridoxal phosphate-dependent aminotransferase [Candidatus Bathyarchaeota archaeon]|nr:MAG: pyridoxal phosphate-dependent aminotransferase [Candidatus Bathyarchaeota archaeon]